MTAEAKLKAQPNDARRARIAAGVCVGACGRRPRPNRLQCDRCARKAATRQAEYARPVQGGRRPKPVKPLADRAAADRLLRENWGQLEAIARLRCRRGVPFEDLFQEACLAFLRCLSGFRALKGQFEHYISRAAINAVLHYLTVYKGPISVDPTAFYRHRRAIKAGVPEDQMPATLVAAAAATNVMRLDARVGEGGGMSMGDMLPAHGETPEEQVHGRRLAERRRRAIERAIATLSPQEAEVVELCYLDGDGCKFAEVGRRMGFSRQWAQQLNNVALEKLRKPRAGLAGLVD